MVKIGATAERPNERTAIMSSSSERMTYGCFFAPGSLSMRTSCFIVSFMTGSGQRSTCRPPTGAWSTEAGRTRPWLGGQSPTLVTTTKSGTLSAIAMPTCSLVMRVMPWLAPTTTMT